MSNTTGIPLQAAPETEGAKLLTLMERLHQSHLSIAAAVDEGEAMQGLMSFADARDVHAVYLLFFSDFANGRPASIRVHKGWTADSPPAPPIGTRLSLTEYPLFATIRADSPLICENVATDERLDGRIRRLMTLFGLGSFAIIPLTISQNWLGVLVIGRKTASIFDQGLIFAWRTLASQLVSVLEYQKLNQERQRYIRELTLLLDTSAAVTASLTVESALNTIVRQITTALAASGCTISALVPERDALVVLIDYSSDSTVGDDHPPGTLYPLADYPESARVLRERRPLVIDANDPDADPVELEWMLESGVKSVLMTPMIARNTVLGLLEITLTDIEREFTRTEIVLCQTLANQAAATLENVRLFQQTERRSVQLQTAAEVSRAASSILDPDELIQQVVDLVRERFDLYYVGLFLLDEAGRWAVLRAGTGAPGRIQLEQGHKLEVGSESMIGWCVANARARISLDVGEETTRFINPLLPDTRSEMALPLISRGQTIGAMTIQSREPAAFSEEDISVLQTMADQLATSIRNARLFEEAKASAAELAVLNELAQALAANLTVREVLQQTFRGVSQLLDTANFYIGLYDPERHKVSFDLDITQSEIDQEIAIIPADQGITGYIIHNRTAVLIRENIEAWMKEKGIDPVGQPAASWLGVPMMIGNQILGVMAIQDYDTPQFYDEHDRDLLTAIANQAAVAVQRARLFEEAQTLAHREQAMRQIVATINAAEDLVQNISAIGEKLRQLVPVDVLTLTSYIPGKTEFTILAVSTELEGGHFAQPGVRSPLEGSAPGWVITHGEPWLDTDFRQNPPFPSDQFLIAEGLASRVLLPLQISERVVGTLNLASSQPGAFAETDVPLLSQVADQITLALERGRLLSETQTALSEVEATHRRYLRQEWENTLSTATDRAWGYLDGPDGLTPADDFWTPEIEQAVATGALETVFQPDAQRNALALPLKLRGEIIGVIDFYDKDRVWTEEDKMLVQALGDQVALALENARLFEISQRSAARERLTGEIVGKIRSAGDINSILETAAQELGRVLGVSRTRVQLGDPANGSHSAESDQADEE